MCRVCVKSPGYFLQDDMFKQLHSVVIWADNCATRCGSLSRFSRATTLHCLHVSRFLCSHTNLVKRLNRVSQILRNSGWRAHTWTLILVHSPYSTGHSPSEMMTMMIIIGTFIEHHIRRPASYRRLPRRWLPVDCQWWVSPTCSSPAAVQHCADIDNTWWTEILVKNTDFSYSTRIRRPC